jgi:hypothetical protein
MSLSEKVEKLSQEIEALEDELDMMRDYKQQNKELENENAYMRDILRQMGIDDIWGDFGINSLSVADVMALEKAIASVKVA